MSQQPSSLITSPAMTTNSNNNSNSNFNSNSNSNSNHNQQIKELQSSDNPQEKFETKHHQTKTSSTTSTCTNNNNIIFQAFAAGSVASSCCLFQLIINLLSTWNILHIGCAGFNGTLGPLRPYTRFMTLAWLVWNWISISIQENNGEREQRESESEKSSCCAKAGANTGRRRRMALVSSTVLCLTLMFMPEMLEQWRHSHFRFDVRGKGKINGIGNDVVKFEYVVDNMGCEACIHAVEKLVNEQTEIGVVRSKVSSFEMGEIDIYVDIDMHVDADAGTRSSGSDSDSDGVDNGWRDRFENELDGVLKEHGYELRPKGWVTKKMKLGRTQNVFRDQF